METDNNKKATPQELDEAYDTGMKKGLEGEGTSKGILEELFSPETSQEEDEAERRGNEAGKAIKAQKDSSKDDEDN